MTKLAVLMNCYNGEKFLRSSLDSIINQTFKDWTLYFFDNQSNDNSKLIFKSYNDTRFKYFSFDRFLNLGQARKKAWSYINSKYVVICDVDDYFHKDRFLNQIEFMENNINYSVVGSAANIVDSNSNLITKIFYETQSKKLKNNIIFQHVFNSATLFFRKKDVDSVGGYNPEYQMVNDYDLLFRLSRVYDIANLRDILVYNRQHNNNLSFQNIVNGQLETLKLQLRIFFYINKLHNRIILLKNILLTIMRIAYHYLKKYVQ